MRYGFAAATSATVAQMCSWSCIQPGVAGFKLATLLKLTFLRDDSGKSLLHFVLDEMTEAGSISDRLMHQLSSTPAAADIQV